MAVILDHELHASRSTNMPLAVTYMMAAEIAERAWTMAEAMLDNEPSARKVAVLLECQRNAQAERDQ
jgi:hypothetical protein